MTIASDTVPDLHVVGAACSAQCLALYRYDENGDRIDNITDWALEQCRQHYKSELDQAALDKGLKPLVPQTGVEEGSAEQSDRSDELGKRLKPLVSEEPFVPAQWWFVTFVTHNARVSERMVTYGVKKGEPLIFSAVDQIFIAEQIAEAVKQYGIAIAVSIPAPPRMMSLPSGACHFCTYDSVYRCGWYHS